MRWKHNSGKRRKQQLSNESQARERERAKVSSSYKEHRENALASGAEEGRDKLRKATGSSKYA